MATIKDVAREAGVSIGTVSATINGTAGVSEKLAQRVWDAVAAVGYSPDGIARSLRLGRTSTIALVISDISNPFFASLAKAVETRANAAGYSVILANTDEDPARELELLNLMRVQRVAGILLAPSGFDDAYRAALARFADMPLVMVDRFLPDMPFDSVIVDNLAAAQSVTDYLLRLGHRRIAIVSGRPHVSTAEQRLRGFRETLQAAGVRHDPALAMTADFRIETAYDAVQALLSRPEPPTAIFAANNMMSLGAMQAVMDMGFRCPEQISVAGIDDFPWSTAIRPRLTTVVQPIEEVGATAVDRLLARLKPAGAKAAPETVTLAPRLLVRESCRRVD